MICIYESHLGGLYVTDKYLDHDYLHCDQCGDSDMLVLSTNDIDEVGEFLRKEADLFGSGGYSICHCNQIYEECEKLLMESDTE